MFFTVLEKKEGEFVTAADERWTRKEKRRRCCLLFFRPSGIEFNFPQIKRGN